MVRTLHLLAAQSFCAFSNLGNTRQVHGAARASLATNLYKLQRMPPLSTINRHARIVIAMLTCKT